MSILVGKGRGGDGEIRPADGLTGEGVLEPDAFRRERVEVGGYVQGLAVRADGVPALLVGEEEDDVRK